MHLGELWLEKALTDTFILGRTVKLSPREGDLVRLLAQGLKNKEIATVLSISEGTVKVYLSKLFVKTGAKDRLELALFGLRNMQDETFMGSSPARTPRALFLPHYDAVALDTEPQPPAPQNRSARRSPGTPLNMTAASGKN